MRPFFFLLSLIFLTGCGSTSAKVEFTPIGDLLTRLNSPDANLRYSALRELKNQGKGAKDAAPQVIAALKDKEPMVRAKACEVLAVLGEGNIAAIDVAMELLKDKDANIREQAAVVLPKLGPESQKAVDALGKLVKNDKEQKVRDAATRALKSLAEMKKFDKS